jgi:hypothetical protein
MTTLNDIELDVEALSAHVARELERFKLPGLATSQGTLTRAD